MVEKIEKYRDTFFEDWYQFDSRVFFFALCILYLLVTMLKRIFIIDEIAAFEILQERGEMWVFDLFFGLQYLTVPVFLAWKFTLTAFLVWVGCFMFGYRVTFSALWKWVMFSELIFVLAEFIKFLFLLVDASDPNYQDIVAFYPFSLMNFFDHQSLDPKWHYPFKALNIFEPIYWLSLIIGVFYLSKKKWNTSVVIVCSSYILFFFLWLGYYVIVYK